MNKIFVSAGHRPGSPGVEFGGVTEHGEASRWAVRLYSLLSNSILVPPGTIREKANFVHERFKPGDVAVEFHMGEQHRSATAESRGCSALYQIGVYKSKTMAEMCADAMKSLYGIHRGVSPGWYRGDSSNSIHFFLSQMMLPAVILMPELIHRWKECRKHEVVCCDLLATCLEEIVK